MNDLEILCSLQGYPMSNVKVDFNSPDMDYQNQNHFIYRHSNKLDHVLCFVMSKFPKCEERQIKLAILRYYPAEDIHAAKEKLLDSVSSITELTCMTKIRNRRGDEDGRSARELDDIYIILNEFNEKKMLRQLPKFVSDCSERMPTSPLIDGDLQAIMNQFRKLEFLVSFLQQSVNKATPRRSNSGGAASCHGQRRLDG